MNGHDVSVAVSGAWFGCCLFIHCLMLLVAVDGGSAGRNNFYVFVFVVFVDGEVQDMDEKWCIEKC